MHLHVLDSSAGDAHRACESVGGNAVKGKFQVLGVAQACKYKGWGKGGKGGGAGSHVLSVVSWVTAILTSGHVVSMQVYSKSIHSRALMAETGDGLCE